MRKRSEWATYYFAVLSPVMFPLGLTAQTMSVFITVASAFDCLVLVAASEKFKSKFCSVNTSILVGNFNDFKNVIVCLKIIVKIFLLGIFYNSPHMYEIYVIDCWSTMYNTASKDVCPTALRSNVVSVGIKNEAERSYLRNTILCDTLKLACRNSHVILNTHFV